MPEQKEAAPHEASKPIEFSTFLESTPPSTRSIIPRLTQTMVSSGTRYHRLLTPELQLHCPAAPCNGIRFFRCQAEGPIIGTDGFSFLYLTYLCSNCRKQQKVFALAAQRHVNADSGECLKLAEFPFYGPPTPPRLLSLIGPDADTFLKGRRCENQGLGVGAFVYYRRVVENQKSRIVNQILKVAERSNASADAISRLKSAVAETQFSKAVALVKDAIPQTLLINGHNPLILLHSALSGGLHEESDEHCLETAASVRVVLAELSERLAQALKDEAELGNAVSRLLQGKSPKQLVASPAASPPGQGSTQASAIP